MKFEMTVTRELMQRAEVLTESPTTSSTFCCRTLCYDPRVIFAPRSSKGITADIHVTKQPNFELMVLNQYLRFTKMM
eukprot:g579.t1